MDRSNAFESQFGSKTVYIPSLYPLRYVQLTTCRFSDGKFFAKHIFFISFDNELWTTIKSVSVCSYYQRQSVIQIKFNLTLIADEPITDEMPINAVF